MLRVVSAVLWRDDGVQLLDISNNVKDFMGKVDHKYSGYASKNKKRSGIVSKEKKIATLCVGHIASGTESQLVQTIVQRTVEGKCLEKEEKTHG